MKFFLLINAEMRTVVGISTLMSRKNGILGLFEPEKCFFIYIIILMSILKFMLSRVEHETIFATLRPGLEVIKHFSCPTQLSMKFSLLINMKMPAYGWHFHIHKH